MEFRKIYVKLNITIIGSKNTDILWKVKDIKVNKKIRLSILKLFFLPETKMYKKKRSKGKKVNTSTRVLNVQSVKDTNSLEVE